jgi:acetyl-CoA acetyltransferase
MGSRTVLMTLSSEGRWENRCIITGIGISRVGRRTGRSGLELTVEAAREAIADAGLTPSDIDGVTTVGETPLLESIPALGLDPTWTGEGGSPVGGSMSGVHNACRAAASGLARHVLVYRSVAMLGGSVMGSDVVTVQATTRDERPRGPRVMDDLPELLAAHAYSAANWVGMHAKRHMHVYGTTREQMGWIAVNARRHAALNPRAIYREPLTIDDYLAARMISDPIGLYDCDVPVDAACAFVVSDAVTASDHPKPAIRVHAAARVSDPVGGWFRRTDYPRMASIDAAKELWTRAELGPRDLDFAELYDGFSFLTMVWLEALGICNEGESGPYVEGGQRIGLDGELPLNTYGGQLSAGRLHGHWVMHEACTQLRGEAGRRQVPAHEVAVISTGGGPFATCMLLTT